MTKEKELIKAVVNISRQVAYLSVIIIVSIVMIIGSLFTQPISNATSLKTTIPLTASKTKVLTTAVILNTSVAADWKAPDISIIPAGRLGDKIRYGKQLLSNTAEYFGPEGSVAHITNGMNCQNCHLESGSRLFANDYAGFVTSYPKLSARSGKVETAPERIVECFERSLDGKAPDTSGKEIQSILAYMKWIGKDVKKGQKPYGSGTEKLAFMDQAADPIKGKVVFMMKCKSCHGGNGEGQFAQDKRSYITPPLWGKNSFNDGAGMYRISNLAGFVKNNMPFGATYQNPQLSNEEAWNVAAFIISKPRPHKNQRNDWKNIKTKPIDFPFGPYADKFNEHQHKYGPFKPIIAIHQKSST